MRNNKAFETDGAGNCAFAFMFILEKPCENFNKPGDYFSERQINIDRLQYQVHGDLAKILSGGEGHCFPKPTVRFEGDEIDLLRAFDLCQFNGFPIHEARRIFRKEWLYQEGKEGQCPIGNIWERPFNEIVFLPISSFSS